MTEGNGSGGPWRRRVGLMAVVGVAVAIPLTLLLRGDPPEEDAEWEWESSPAASSEPITPGSSLDARRVDRDLGLSYRLPQAWEQEREDRVLRLRSPGGAVLVALSSPAPAARADGVLREALRAIRSGYRDVEIDRGSGRRIGGLSARGAVASATGSGGGKLRILVAVSRGDELTHLLQVFSAADAAARDLADAQRIINTLRYRR